MPLPTVDVIIPTYKPEPSFRDLLLRLRKQTYPIDHILIINTDAENWDEDIDEEFRETEVFHIKKSEFDHAAARNMGAGFSNADYLVFMTQDAVPADDRLIESLIAGFSSPLIKAVYARQLPRRTCKIPEGCVRSFNYPEASCVHSIEDTAKIGVKAFFCSNVCAAYEHGLFREMHGFSEPAIFNEDMVYAGRIEILGYSVAYQAEARVYHSHNYSNLQQFHRNFDNGVSQAMHPEIFGRFRSEGEGMKMVIAVTKELLMLGRIYLIPGFFIQCGFRFAGFKLGKNYRHLPAFLVRHFSMSKTFWEKLEAKDSDEE